MVINVYNVFVYGSLKKGFGNHGFLSQSRIISKNYIKPLRGNIYDRNGIILAYNEVVFSLVLKKPVLPNV